MVRLFKWILCAGLIVLLGAGGLYHGHRFGVPGSIESVEQKLTTEIQTALDEAQQSGWARVDLEGQKAIISGVAPSPQARASALAAVRAATGSEGVVFGGITHIDEAAITTAYTEEAPTNGETAGGEAITTAEALPVENPYRFRADYQGNYIRIAETLPDEAAQTRLGTYIEEIFPQRQYFDNTRLARGAPDDDWVAMIEAALYSLSALDKGVFYVEGRNVKISGQASTSAAGRLAAERARLLPPAYGVTTDIDSAGRKIHFTIAPENAPATDLPESTPSATPDSTPISPEESASAIDHEKFKIANQTASETGDIIKVPAPSQVLDADQIPGLPPAPVPLAASAPLTASVPEPEENLPEENFPEENQAEIVPASLPSEATPPPARSPLYQSAGDDDEKLADKNYRTCTNEIALLLQHQPIGFIAHSEQLTPASRPGVAAIADVMLRCPGYDYKISGYTDNIDTDEADPALGTRRAQTVIAYLVSRSVKPGILKNERSGTPTAIIDNTANRQIDITIIDTQRD